jgi:uncharacterized protein with NRDE domain
MCTVTYLPIANNNFILTSNRDETPLRKTISPQKYNEYGVELIYPKDELAGGTWIGTSNKNRLGCLLNGGFKKHTRNSYYKMSRGVIVKKILSADKVFIFINEFDFNDIEPFTLILVDWSQQLETYELVWDGVKKHFIKLPQEPKIWSSSTLYTDHTKALRKELFSNWLADNKEFEKEKIIAFHKTESLENKEISLKMKRFFVETVSITCVIKEDSKIDITYFNLLNNTTKKVQTK